MLGAGYRGQAVHEQDQGLPHLLSFQPSVALPVGERGSEVMLSSASKAQARARTPGTALLRQHVTSLNAPVPLHTCVILLSCLANSSSSFRTRLRLAIPGTPRHR